MSTTEVTTSAPSTDRPTPTPTPPASTSTTLTPATPTSTSTTSQSTATTPTDTSTSSTSASTRTTTSFVTAAPGITTSPTRAAPTTTRGPSVVTSTSVFSITASHSVTPSSTADAATTTGKGFFQNTGAVAGTFSAVGLVALAIIVVLITTTIRRRRAKKFDREIAEAAREAALTQLPVFLDDDDDDHGRGGGAGAYSAANSYGPNSSGPYSDGSHGTYQQNPMAPESYGMREIGRGPAPGEVFDYATAGAGVAGAAGIGVARARSARDGGSYGRALQDGASPYPAFIAPTGSATPQPPPGQHPYARDYSPRSRELDVMEAAGMGGYVAGAEAGLARGQTQYQNRNQGFQQQQQQQEGLTRNKSLVGHEGEVVYPSANGGGQYYATGNDPYASHYTPPIPQQQSYSPYPQAQYQQIEGDTDDAYGGYVVSDEQQQAPHLEVLPNPFDGSTGDDNQPRRVLKVAN